ncbi:MAG: hypothetical protein LBE11_02855 [Prevotellaceae bacterium]|nr:hypothetical protein [Prevotellaceae bacterium]
MIPHIRRTVKFAIYLIILLLLILTFIYLMSKNVMSENASLNHFLEDGRPLQMLCLVVVFAVIYPFIGFAKVKIYLNQPVNEDKNEIIELFAQRKYVLVSDENKILTFRPKNKFNRLTRMYEDLLELDYSDTVLKFQGLRKDVYRYKRMLEEFAQKNRTED